MTDYEFSTVSVGNMANQFALGGMSPGEAVQKAKEEFPKRLSELLEQGWEILIGDSDIVYLRKKKK